jgi:predicted AlkP superfamily pyrophosphatase or phosphodiesterase
VGREGVGYAAALSQLPTPNHMKLNATLAFTMLLFGSGAKAQTYVPPTYESSDSPEGSSPTRPRLVLQITVDQLRGDLLRRYEDSWGEGGFRRLLEEGAVYANAHHAHANTETVVGHSTLATGAHPGTHGMIGNLWMERGEDVPKYNVEDPDSPVLSTRPLVDQATEIDPTQRAATSDGRSPRAILVSTFGDELKLFTGGRAKVFGVSIKDRGAITLAGHTGTAYWFSKTTGEFVTSDYYMQAYPEWAQKWNAAGHAARYSGSAWALSGKSESYLFGDADDRPYETDLAGFGRIFPHEYGSATGKYFTTLLTVSPAGDELTLDFAKSVLAEEGLGQDAVTDYLSVSFSSTDYVGHVFGASSLESEDNLRRLDRTLAQLLDFVDERVGLDRTVVVLSADHGGTEAPGYLRELGFDAGYIQTEEEMKAAVNAALTLRFGEGADLMRGFYHPYVYLDHAAIAERDLDADEVAEAIAKTLEDREEIAYTYTREAMEEGEFADSRVARCVLHNFSPARSGAVYVVTKPGYFVNDFDGLTVAATHGSPWRYDTHVPVIFFGAGIGAQTIQREVFTVDVAASLAALTGTKLPSGCEGEPLVELFR